MSIEVVREFVNAQKLSATVDQIADGLSVLSTDDDYGLINTYVVADEVPSENDLRDLVSTKALESNRTMLVVNDGRGVELRQSSCDLGRIVNRISCLSDFLDGHLRPRALCDRLLNPGHGSEAARLLDDSDFVAQDCVRAADGKTVDAMPYLFESWANSGGPRFCILLGPAGHGKSKVTHILTKRLARAYRDSRPGFKPPLPFLISFGEYRRSTSFGGLVLSALNSYGQALLTVEAFQYLVNLGRVLFILDGFDEMVEASAEMARGNIRDFIQHSGSTSRILLTSRSVFFRSRADVEAEFENQLLDEEHIDLVELLPFDRLKAKEYLAKRLKDVDPRSNALNRAHLVLDDPEGFQALQAPIFLSEFADSLQDEKWSLDDLRREGLHEFLVTRVFDRERKRQSHAFTDGEQRAFLQSFALEMLATQENGFARELLEVFVSEVVDEPSKLSRWEALASHHFLTDLPGTNDVSMRHQLWREYFQGSAVAARVQSGGPGRVPSLSVRDLPEGVARHAAASLGTEGLRRLSTAPEMGSRQFARNTIRMALLLPLDGQERLEVLSVLGGLTKRDLAGVGFSDLDCSASSFAGSDLRGASFIRCVLTDVNFQDASIDRVNFTNCRLDEGLLAGDVAAVVIDGKSFYGDYELADLFGLPTVLNSAEPLAGALSTTELRRSWAGGVLRSRLSRFVKTVDERSWIEDVIDKNDYLRGVPPQDRDFAARKLYRTMRALGFISEVRSGHTGATLIAFTSSQDLRRDVMAFIDTAEERGPIAELLDRLTS
jgi:NACHT domain/Pentapeptide repeats (9 copies)